MSEKKIEIPVAIGVRDLAQKMGISPIDAIKKLMMMVVAVKNTFTPKCFLLLYFER